MAIAIDAETPAARVSDRYLSIAVDVAQVVGGQFWNPDAEGAEAEVPVPPFDFADPTLRALTAELSPAVLRIGGTAADLVYYDLDGSGALPEGYEHALTAEAWGGAVDFARDLDLELMFTLNAGQGPRTEGGPWETENARALIARAAEDGAPVTVWELGNEINGFPLLHGLALSPEDWARDLGALRALLDEVQPEARTAGPSSAYWPEVGEFVPFAEVAVPAAGAALDVVTWHYYPQQSVRCPVATRPASAEGALEEAFRAEVEIWAAEAEAQRDQANPAAEVWLGETGNAQCGGQPGVSDAFASGFWWLDQLGRLAHRGQQVVVRQTLSGSDYGLLSDDGAWSPRPDYWTSVLHKRLVGPVVLDADAPAPLTAWAHCARDGGVVALVLNPSEEAVSVGIEGARDLTGWILDAPSLDSREVRLGGVDLPITPDLPPLAGTPGRRGVVDLPPRSYGFVVAADVDAPACR